VALDANFGANDFETDELWLWPGLASAWVSELNTNSERDGNGGQNGNGSWVLPLLFNSVLGFLVTGVRLIPLMASPILKRNKEVSCQPAWNYHEHYATYYAKRTCEFDFERNAGSKV